MKELQVFKNEKFGEIRTVEINGNPWFVAADVCKTLGIKNSRDAITRLDEDERDVVLTDTPSGMQEMNVVNEPGLYSLVLGSRKKYAKEFKRWIVHDVIPSIRKTGYYSLIPKDYPSALRAYAVEVEKNMKLMEENEVQRKTIKAYSEKIKYCSKAMQSKQATTITEIAKKYGITPRQFNKILVNAGIQHREGKQWILNEEYSGCSYTKLSSVSFTKWTDIGVSFLDDVMREMGIDAIADR